MSPAPAPSDPERRLPGWVVLAGVVVLVAIAATIILLGPRR